MELGFFLLAPLLLRMRSLKELSSSASIKRLEKHDISWKLVRVSLHWTLKIGTTKKAKDLKQCNIISVKKN